MAFDGFTQAYFDFFNDLSQNNEREWFTDNKSRYERDVAGPLLAYVEAISPFLTEISPFLKADPRRNGGSMFRIYRDTRFSKDKTPYKTHGALQFRHVMGRDVHAPGFYLHAGPAECVIGIGIWRPDGPSTQKIRDAIVQQEAAWVQARDDANFNRYFQTTGESLKKPPRGFDKDHPQIEDIKRKDFIAMHGLTHAEFMAPDFVQKTAEMFAASTPYMKFLCNALELPF